MKSHYAATALDGEGARRFGGRWNPPGVPAIYASDSLALAMLEILVHFDPALPMADYVALALDIPDDAIYVLDPEFIPGAWPRHDSIPFTQRLGNEQLILRNGFAIGVPSAVVPEALNYVINPAHPDFPAWALRHGRKAPRPIRFDARLIAARASALSDAAPLSSKKQKGPAA